MGFKVVLKYFKKIGNEHRCIYDTGGGGGGAVSIPIIGANNSGAARYSEGSLIRRFVIPNTQISYIPGGSLIRK